MNKFKTKFLDALDEDIFGGKSPVSDGPMTGTPEGDADALASSMEQEGEIDGLGASVDAVSSSERQAEQDELLVVAFKKSILKWQNRLLQFDGWLEEDLLTGLDKIENRFSGVIKKVEKEVESLRKSVGIANTELGLLPRDIQREAENEKEQAENEGSYNDSY